MRKGTIIEAQNSNTVYESGTQKGILGKLKGIFADYEHGTRNADRQYTEELWDNRVFGSEDVMEALETKTLFGELDHPEGDRCETLAKNAAISITKLEKKPEEGVIYGEAEILDTPTGRILKSLADSGAKLGVSSRGMGDVICVEGKNIIDPDTYDFITFDVVVTPANTKARVTLTESKKLSKLNENIQREITECETTNQLNQVKKVLENVNIENKEEVLQQINEKLTVLEQKNIVKTKRLTETNKTIAIKYLKEKIQNIKLQNEEINKSTEQLYTENKNLIEEKENVEKSRSLIKSKLREVLEEKSVVLDELNNTKSTIKVIEGKLEETTNKLMEANTIISNNSKKEENRKFVQDAKMESIEKTYNEKILRLENVNKQLTQKLLTERNLVEENRKLTEQIHTLQENGKKESKILLEAKISEQNRVKNLEEKLKILEEKNRVYENTQKRFSKLDFNPICVGTLTKEENRSKPNMDYNDEDLMLLNALTKR